MLALLNLLGPLAIGWLLAVLAERWAQPLQRSAWRDRYALLIHAGLFGLLYFIVTALTLRPIFSSGVVLALLGTVIVVNNAKFKALQEAFVFTDFSLFSQAIKHPRLYLPFLNPVAAVLGPLAILSVVYLGLTLDSPLTEHLSWAQSISALLLGAAISILLIFVGTRGVAKPSFDIHADIGRYGLLSSLWVHRLAEAANTPVQQHPGLPLVSTPAPTQAGTADLPHIIVVQSESFFDARRLLPSVRPELLRAYDLARQQAVYAGRLQVPAWGANTMRTEFAFLTGIERAQLGVHAFNPYRKLARRPLDSLASRLAGIGYDTLCIHPHPAAFFGRDQVFPALGFKRFLGIESFQNAVKVGPYTGDAAVTDKVLDVLASARQATLVFAITMENHGPLHLEKVSQAELAGLYTHPPIPVLRTYRSTCGTCAMPMR